MKIYKFNPKHEKRSLFAKILFAVGAIQLALLLLLGGMIVKEILPQQAVLIEAVPPPLDDSLKDKAQRVVIKDWHKKMSPPPRPIAVERPDISVKTDFTVNVSISGGYGDGGFDGGFVLNPDDIRVKEIAIPERYLGDIKVNSDRVFIAFEVSEEVMRDEMGGFDAFNIIKEEIKALVESLPPTIMFNVMAFDTHHKILYHTCFPALVSANAQNKGELVKWMDSINPNPENVGLKWNSRHEYKLKNPSPAFPQISFHYDGQHRHEVVGRYGVYQAAIESKAGAVWILSRAWPEPENYYMSLSGEAEKRYMSQWEKNVKDFERGGKKAAGDAEYHAWIKSTESARQKAKAWLENENRRRESKGVPKRVITDMLALAHELKIAVPEKPVTKNDLRPPVPKFKTYKRSTLFAAYEPILKANYDANKLDRPRVNIIMLLGRKDELNSKRLAAVSSWSKLNNEGGSRVLRAGRPVSEYN